MNAILAMAGAVKHAQTLSVPFSVAVSAAISWQAMGGVVWTLMSVPLLSTTVRSCAGTLQAASYATATLDTPWMAMEEHVQVSHGSIEDTLKFIPQLVHHLFDENMDKI